jgi:hypothetical protein
MKTFKDTKNRQWELSLTLGIVKRVKDALGVDLLQPESGDPPTLTRLGTDELLLAEVIVNLLYDQFDRHLMEADEIYDAFDGATLHAAHSTFYEEWIDFFLRLGRPERVRAIQKQQKMIEAGIRAVELRVDQLDVDLVVSAIMKVDPTESILNSLTAGKKSIVSPGPLASTPTD